jgi:roundabout axon guidance receptor 2
MSSTSINITWKLFKPSSLLEGYYIKFKPVGTKEYQIETVSNSNNRRNYYVLTNLKKFTTYEILVEPYRGQLKASESNVIQAKTKEDLPSHSPVSLQIHMDSLTSILIKWQPPPQEHMNGIILGYKVIIL